MPIPEHVLVHTATPVSYLEQQQDPAEWIEGEPGPGGGGVPTPGEAFACVLFLPGPGGGADTPYRPRAVSTPTVLYNPTRDVSRPGLVADGSPIVVGSEDELLVSAPELAPWTGAAVQRWLAAGEAQPFGPPGSVIGVLQALRRVAD